MKGLNFKKILCSMLLVALICQMGVSSVVAETNDIKPVEHEVVEETVDEEVPVEISTTENFYYISDLDYVSENRWSYSSWGEIKKDTNIDGVEIKANDYMALVEKDIVACKPNKLDAVKVCLDKLVDEDSELITLLVGEDVVDEEVEEIESYIEDNFDAEVDIIEGKQPVYSFIIGVE